MLPRPPASGTLIVVPPPPDLAPLVEYVWQLVLPGSETPGAVWRVVVDGYVDLAMTLPLGAELRRAAGEASRSGAARRALAERLAAGRRVVCGAATAARLLPADAPLLVTGARFRLGAPAGVLRQAPAELVDGARSLDDVLDRRAASDAERALVGTATRDPSECRAAAALRPEAARDDRLLEALARVGVAQVVRRLVARAAARPGGARPADSRVRHALRLLDRPEGDAADGAPRVGAVARALAVSPRTLERLFAEHVGFAPRSYQRLRRVGAVAEALERPGGGADALSALAHAVGYADHAHMTREFTRVMGVTPSRYRREARTAPVARHVGAVEFERTTPVGTVGVASATPTAP